MSKAQCLSFQGSYSDQIIYIMIWVCKRVHLLEIYRVRHSNVHPFTTLRGERWSAAPCMSLLYSKTLATYLEYTFFLVH